VAVAANGSSGEGLRRIAGVCVEGGAVGVGLALAAGEVGARADGFFELQAVIRLARIRI
jgi:hypothetical protein